MDVLQFDFMRRAILACALVGLAAPSIGVYLVQRRLALMGDGIGHVAFMGVAAGFLLGTLPVVTAMVAAALGAFTIELLRERGRTAGDVALAVIFYGGIAGGALLTFLAGAGNKSLSYLFGSVLTVNDSELVIVAVVTVTVLALTFGFRKELFLVSYDEEVARAAGLPVRKLNLLVALITAVTIGVTMKVVGLLLVSGMLVLPVAAVQQVTASFRATIGWSLVLGLVVSVGGLLAAFYGNLVPGATIVLLSIAAFVATSVWTRLRGLRSSSAGSAA
ncbi:MAG: metal ABC transporter permease [Actinomycetota bacterium]|nr:metal ABC transporter permease [Actinomycetota bacterium]